MQVQAVFREIGDDLLENSMEKPDFKGVLRQYDTAWSKAALAHRLSSIWGKGSLQC